MPAPPTIDMDLCTLCDICIVNCPLGAISEENDIVSVNSQICDPNNDDYACVDMCETDAIIKPS